MRKTVVLLVMLCAGMSAFAFDMYVSGGYGYSFYFKNAEFGNYDYNYDYLEVKGKKTKQTSNIAAAFEFYWMDHIGLYANIGVDIPHKVGIGFGGIDRTYSDFDLAYGASTGIGPAFRFPVSIVDFMIAPFVSAEYGGIIKDSWSGSGYTEAYVALGLGLDLKVRINCTEHFFIQAGAIGKFNFFDAALNDDDDDDYGVSSFFGEKVGMSFSIMPALSLGFRL